MPPQFPARRSDGTVSVGARFEVEGEARQSVNAYAASWREAAPPGLVNALSSPPFIEEVSDAVIEIVFDSSAEHRLWKDAMVFFVSNIPEGAGRFIGFYDRVAGRMHPSASFIE